MYSASLAVVLAILWLLLSGHFADPLLLGLGAVSIMVTVLASWRMGILGREGHPIHLALRALVFWPWLLKEIVIANLDVAKAILGLSGSIRPIVFSIKASQASELGRVIYANAITLTPGTVTIALEDSKLTIHALQKSAREGLETGEMDRRVTELEGDR